MKLNHLNLVVADVTAAQHFFEAFFNFTCVETKGENVVAVLKSPDGFTLVLMKSKGAGYPIYPDAFHIGFMLDSADKVNEAYQKLKAAGFTGETAPKKIRDSFGFYFNFENLMIEVGYYF